MDWYCWELSPDDKLQPACVCEVQGAKYGSRDDGSSPVEREEGEEGPTEEELLKGLT